MLRYRLVGVGGITPKESVSIDLSNVRFGSKADLSLEVLRTSAFGGKADVKNK